MLSENPREKKRPFFFLTGLIISLSFVIIVLQSSTLVRVDPNAPIVELIADVTTDMPITVMIPEKKPEPKRLVAPVPDPTVDPDPILVIPIGSLGGDVGGDGEAPVPIGQELGLEDAVPVDLVFLEYIAVPASCQGLATREEKMSCMNRWINNYLGDNLHYPPSASKLGLSDKVILSFVISPTGEITEVEVKKGEYQILNEEAVRALEAMPDWVPARQFTNNVPMRMMIPVQFRTR